MLALCFTPTRYKNERTKVNIEKKYRIFFMKEKVTEVTKHSLCILFGRVCYFMCVGTILLNIIK